MPLPIPTPGLVISYGYLWGDEHLRGAEEARKARPSVIILAVKDEDGDTVVYVAPVTHAAPADAVCIEIPQAVKRRLGMDDARSWIVAEELNRFLWPGFDLQPISRSQPDTFQWGYLPVALFNTVRNALLECRRKGRMHLVGRT